MNSIMRPLANSALREQIECYLASCGEPALLSPGHPPLPLRNYAFRDRATGLVLEAWDDMRTLAHRISSIKESRPDRLVLITRRFNGTTGKLTLVDLSRPDSAASLVRCSRELLREQFRTWIYRQFPGAHLKDLTTGADLEHTLSPSCPRALFRYQGSAWAALAAPPNFADSALTFALIWLAYLRKRELSAPVCGMVLFLPAGRETNTLIRLHFLNVRFRLFRYDQTGFEAPIDPSDHGNLISEIAPQAEQAERQALRPEAWLESMIRSDPRVLDPSLLPSPVYGQVPALSGIDRGVLDLLAIDTARRLCVIELKTTEDPNLPVQALDYWIRVAHHAECGDFGAHGFFPGIAVSPAPPRLMLVAPALQFHPTTETVLSFFSAKIAVERVGLGVEWQWKPRVVLRVTGAQRPEWDLPDL